jgi:8-amino-7-oxononanoate synthase
MNHPENSLNEARETVDRVRRALLRPKPSPPSRSAPAQGKPAPAQPAAFDFGSLPEYERLKIQKAAGEIAGIGNPFYRLHEERAGDTTSIAGKRLVNFSSYDYLGLNGHPAVAAAAKEAIDRFGTSVSASRLTAGERPVHGRLEQALAALHGTEDAVTFVSGHATNVSVIGSLLGVEDLVVTDTLIHNSVVEGIRLSGAKRILCPHGDLEAFERALRLNRAKYRRALIVIEGLYSMDGDMPDLAGFVKVKQRYDAWLMVDEAHSIGVLGASGRGIAQEQQVDAAAVDIWMGTLSKTLTATGGYIAGSRKLIDLLKYTSPGLVYSVGLSPPVAAAAAAALDVMTRETWRIGTLRRNGQAFLCGAEQRGLNTGPSIGASVVPIIVGSSPAAVILSHRLAACGYNVVPIIFPGVAENQARLRFFITSRHSTEQIEGVLDAVARELPRVLEAPSFVGLMSSGGTVP